MRSIRPQLKARIINVAEDQPEYEPVLTAIVRHPDFNSHFPNTRLMAFVPTPEELELLNKGEAVYVGLLCFDKPQTPMNIMVGKEVASLVYNVPVDDTKPEASADAIYDLFDRSERPEMKPARKGLITLFAGETVIFAVEAHLTRWQMFLSAFASGFKGVIWTEKKLVVDSIQITNGSPSVTIHEEPSTT